MDLSNILAVHQKKCFFSKGVYLCFIWEKNSLEINEVMTTVSNWYRPSELDTFIPIREKKINESWQDGLHPVRTIYKLNQIKNI